MIFTAFGQCTAGGFIVLVLALLKGNLRAEAQQRIIVYMFSLRVLTDISLIASMFHLGSPVHVFSSFDQVGASALSDEIANGSIFSAVGGIGWLPAMLKRSSPVLRTLQLVVTMVSGVIFVWMMVRMYNSIDTALVWYSIWIPIGFFLTMFIGGPLPGCLLLSLAGVDGWTICLLPAISALTLVVGGMMSVMQGTELATIHSSAQQAAVLVPDYGALMSWRIVLLAVALRLRTAPQLRGYQLTIPLLSVSFILPLAGELISYDIFYDPHMTVGMAVASQSVATGVSTPVLFYFCSANVL